MKTEQSVADIIRYHRKKAGLSQEALAKLSGVGKTAVFDLEKGKQSAQLDTLMKILRALNIRVRFESPLMREFDRGESL